MSPKRSIPIVHCVPRLLAVALITATVFAHAQTPRARAYSNTPSAVVFATRLRHSLKAEKLRPGDRVEFVAVGPTLIPGPTVVPGNAVFHATVLAASTAMQSNGMESRVSILVSSVTWENRNLPVCATIGGFVERVIKVMPPERRLHSITPSNGQAARNEAWGSDAVSKRSFAAPNVGSPDQLTGLFPDPEPILVMHPDEYVHDISLTWTPSGATELVRKGKELHLSSNTSILLRPIAGCSL